MCHASDVISAVAGYGGTSGVTTPFDWARSDSLEWNAKRGRTFCRSAVSSRLLWRRPSRNATPDVRKVAPLPPRRTLLACSLVSAYGGPVMTSFAASEATIDVRRSTLGTTARPRSSTQRLATHLDDRNR